MTANHTPGTDQVFDVIVAGGGLAARAAVLAIAETAPGAHIAWVDPGGTPPLPSVAGGPLEWDGSECFADLDPLLAALPLYTASASNPPCSWLAGGPGGPGEGEGQPSWTAVLDDPGTLRRLLQQLGIPHGAALDENDPAVPLTPGLRWTGTRVPVDLPLRLQIAMDRHIAQLRVARYSRTRVLDVLRDPAGARAVGVRVLDRDHGFLATLLAPQLILAGAGLATRSPIPPVAPGGEPHEPPLTIPADACHAVAAWARAGGTVVCPSVDLGRLAVAIDPTQSQPDLRWWTAADTLAASDSRSGAPTADRQAEPRTPAALFGLPPTASDPPPPAGWREALRQATRGLDPQSEPPPGLAGTSTSVSLDPVAVDVVDDTSYGPAPRAPAASPFGPTEAPPGAVGPDMSAAAATHGDAEDREISPRRGPLDARARLAVLLGETPQPRPRPTSHPERDDLPAAGWVSAPGDTPRHPTGGSERPDFAAAAVVAAVGRPEVVWARWLGGIAVDGPDLRAEPAGTRVAGESLPWPARLAGVGWVRLAAILLTGWRAGALAAGEVETQRANGLPSRRAVPLAQRLPTHGLHPAIDRATVGVVRTRPLHGAPVAGSLERAPDASAEPTGTTAHDLTAELARRAIDRRPRLIDRLDRALLTRLMAAAPPHGTEGHALRLADVPDPMGMSAIVGATTDHPGVGREPGLSSQPTEPAPGP